MLSISTSRAEGRRPMRKLYVGIDLGCKTCAGAVRDSKGKLLETYSFPTSAENLIDFVGKQEGEVRVLIEECELAGWVYRTLLPHVHSVEVSDPRHNAWIAKGKRKSDPVDAAKLSELLRGGFYRAVHHPEEEEMATFKIAVQHYDQMTKTTTRLQNQIRARFRQQGDGVRGKGPLRGKWQTEGNRQGEERGHSRDPAAGLPPPGPVSYTHLTLPTIYSV